MDCEESALDLSMPRFEPPPPPPTFVNSPPQIVWNTIPDDATPSENDDSSFHSERDENANSWFDTSAFMKESFREFANIAAPASPDRAKSSSLVKRNVRSRQPQNDGDTPFGCKVEYTVNQKGFHEILMDGYRFQRIRTAPKRTYWRCANKACPSRLVVEDGYVSRASGFPHSHPVPSPLPPFQKVLKKRSSKSDRLTASLPYAHPASTMQSTSALLSSSSSHRSLETLLSQTDFEALCQRAQVLLGLSPAKSDQPASSDAPTSAADNLLGDELPPTQSQLNTLLSAISTGASPSPATVGSQYDALANLSAQLAAAKNTASKATKDEPKSDSKPMLSGIDALSRDLMEKSKQMNGVAKTSSVNEHVPTPTIFDLSATNIPASSLIIAHKAPILVLSHNGVLVHAHLCTSGSLQESAISLQESSAVRVAVLSVVNLTTEKLVDFACNVASQKFESTLVHAKPPSSTSLDAFVSPGSAILPKIELLLLVKAPPTVVAVVALVIALLVAIPNHRFNPQTALPLTFSISFTHGTRPVKTSVTVPIQFDVKPTSNGLSEPFAKPNLVGASNQQPVFPTSSHSLGSSDDIDLLA